MNKKVTIELTQEEYEALCRVWETSKNSPIMPSKALNFDDFCKEALIMLTKAPDFSNFNIEDFISSLGDLSNLKDAFGGLNKKNDKPSTTLKKDEIPDDKKYKS